MSQVNIHPKLSLNEPQQDHHENESKQRTSVVQYLVATGITLASGTAFAADPGNGMEQVVQTITGAIATVSAIGLAVLSLFVTAKVFKWVKTAM